jgi:hypothetical protein
MPILTLSSALAGLVSAKQAAAAATNSFDGKVTPALMGLLR